MHLQSIDCDCSTHPSCAPGFVVYDAVLQVLLKDVSDSQQLVIFVEGSERVLDVERHLGLVFALHNLESRSSYFS